MKTNLYDHVQRFTSDPKHTNESLHRLVVCLDLLSQSLLEEKDNLIKKYHKLELYANKLQNDELAYKDELTNAQQYANHLINEIKTKENELTAHKRHGKYDELKIKEDELSNAKTLIQKLTNDIEVKEREIQSLKLTIHELDTKLESAQKYYTSRL